MRKNKNWAAVQGSDNPELNTITTCKDSDFQQNNKSSFTKVVFVSSVIEEKKEDNPNESRPLVQKHLSQCKGKICSGYSQIKRVGKALKKLGVATMLQLSRITNIERASICRCVAILKRKGKLWVCRIGICPISGHRAQILTMSRTYTQGCYIRAVDGIINSLDEEQQISILLAIVLRFVDKKPFDENEILQSREALDAWRSVEKILRKAIQL